jgi:hypothetical protein
VTDLFPFNPSAIKEYEPDKHCGVQNDLGNPCVRKLDCKIHTVGDKRNVAGRTMSYDDCLRVYRGEAPRGNGPEAGNGSGLGTSESGALKGAKRARKRGGVGLDDASMRRRLGMGVDTDEKEEDWAAHPIAAMHEFAALLESVRRENVLLEGVVRRRAYDELDGRVAGRGFDGSQQSGQKGRKADRKDELPTVPPPSQGISDPDSSIVPQPVAPEPAFGGFGFLEAVAPVPPPVSKPAAQGIKDEQGLDKSPKATIGKDLARGAAPTSAPTPMYGPNLLARETFAGGATTGSWHFDRRRMLGAEKCFGDILAQLQG